MSVKRRILLIGVAMMLPLFLVFGVTQVVYSEDTASENQTEINIEEKGGVELNSKRFPYNRYFANNEDHDSMIRGAFVGFANLSFTLAGFVALGVDKSMETMFALEPIGLFADLMTDVSESVYSTLQTYFGELFFVIAIGYLIYLFIVRGSVKEILRRTILMVLVLTVGGYWMMNAGYLLKSMNTLSIEAQGYLLEAGNGLISMSDGEGVYEDTENIDPYDRLNGTVSVMRNIYFEMAIKKPYLIANYGTTSESDVNDQDGTEIRSDFGGSHYNRVDRLLAFDLTNDGMEDRLSYVDFEISEYENENVGSGNVFQQLGISLLALFGSIGIGIPFFLLPFFNLLIEVIALALAFAIPFAFMLALIPHFANSGFVVMGKLLSVFVIKAMLGILILFVYVLCFIVDTLLPPNDFAMYLVNLVVMIGLFILMVWKRDAIVKVITAGKVQSIDNNMIQKVQRDMVNPALKPIQNKVGGLRLESSKQAKGNQQSTASNSTAQTPSLNRETPVSSHQKGVATEHRTPQAEEKEQKSTGIKEVAVNQSERTPQATRKERKEEQQRQKKADQQMKQGQALKTMNDKEKTERRATKQSDPEQVIQRSKQLSSTNQSNSNKDLQSRERTRKARVQGVTNLEDHKALRSLQKDGETPASSLKPSNSSSVQLSRLSDRSIREGETLKAKERESKPTVQTGKQPQHIKPVEALSNKEKVHSAPSKSQERQPIKQTFPQTKATEVKSNQPKQINQYTPKQTENQTFQELRAIEKEDERHSRRG